MSDFTQWWVAEVGHPPSDARERFAFEMARKAWDHLTLFVVTEDTSEVLQQAHAALGLVLAQYNPATYTAVESAFDEVNTVMLAQQTRLVDQARQLVADSEESARCRVCGEPMHSMPSGLMCSNGHRGT